MKTLRFNRESACKAYLSYFPILERDKRKLESLLLRGELLARNPLFIQDLEKWERLRANPQHTTSQRNKERTVFIKRWHVDPYNGMYWNAGNSAVQRALTVNPGILKLKEWHRSSTMTGEGRPSLSRLISVFQSGGS